MTAPAWQPGATAPLQSTDAAATTSCHGSANVTSVSVAAMATYCVPPAS